VRREPVYRDGRWRDIPLQVSSQFFNPSHGHSYRHFNTLLREARKGYRLGEQVELDQAPKLDRNLKLVVHTRPSNLCRDGGPTQHNIERSQGEFKQGVVSVIDQAVEGLDIKQHSEQ